MLKDLDNVYLSLQGESNRGLHLRLQCHRPTRFSYKHRKNCIDGWSTFSGWATIIWQSMKMSGIPLCTHDRIGAPRMHTLEAKWNISLISDHPSLYWVQSACSLQCCEPIIVFSMLLR